jgi:hypothetical protein
MVPAEVGSGVAYGGGSSIRSAIPGAWWGSLLLEQGSLKLLRRWSCSALSAASWRERSSISCRSAVLFGGWINASEGRLRCDLRDAVRIEGCGVKAALLLTGENGLYVGG